MKVSILLERPVSFLLPLPQQWRIQRGLVGFKRTTLEPKLFHFHEEFQEQLAKLHKSNPRNYLEPPFQKSWIRPCTAIELLANKCNPPPHTHTHTLSPHNSCFSTHFLQFKVSKKKIINYSKAIWFVSQLVTQQN